MGSSYTHCGNTYVTNGLKNEGAIYSSDIQGLHPGTFKFSRKSSFCKVAIRARTSAIRRKLRTLMRHCSGSHRERKTCRGPTRARHANHRGRHEMQTRRSGSQSVQPAKMPGLRSSRTPESWRRWSCREKRPAKPCAQGVAIQWPVGFLKSAPRRLPRWRWGDPPLPAILQQPGKCRNAAPLRDRFTFDFLWMQNRTWDESTGGMKRGGRRMARHASFRERQREENFTQPESARLTAS